MITHTETIKCPECGKVQTATVEHTQLFDTKIHHCECGLTITESDWQMVENNDARKPRCHNCKFAGNMFKIGKLTHTHCQSEQHAKARLDGTLSPWDTLQVFSSTCSFHQFKQKAP